MSQRNVATECGEKSDVLVYWRRLGEPAFPVHGVRSVEVLAPEEYREKYGGSPSLGASAGAWNAVHGDDDCIDESLGLCGELSEVSLICDAILVSAAIHRHLGLSMSRWDEDCMWMGHQLDSHGPEDAECYFATMGEVYGADAEAAARRQYAKEEAI